MSELIRKSQNGFYNDITAVIQKHIDNIVLVEYKWDTQCQPKFTVSVMSEPEGDYIILTIDHRFVQFSEKIFPRDDSHFGYESLHEIVEQLFARTM